MSGRTGGILSRLTLSFLLLCWSVGAVVSLLSFLASRSFLERSIAERLELGAYEKEAEVRRWVNSRRRDFLLLTGLPGVAREITAMASGGAEGREALRAAFADFLSHMPEFRELMVLSPEDGRVLLSTERSREGDYRTRDAFFLRGKEGFTSREVHISPLTGRPSIDFSLPLRRADGSAVAVLAGTLRLERLHQAVLHLSRLGDTAAAYFVDKHGLLVASSRSGREPQAKEIDSPGVRKGLGGESGTGSYRNHDGVPVVGVYRWIPDLSLALVVEVEREEADGPARRLGLQILLAGTAVALLASLLVRLLAERLSRPVVAMASAASRLAAGDFTVRASRCGVRELDDLADAYNGMVEGLLEGKAALERKVEEVRESEERYRVLAENANDVIWTMDGRGVITYMSPSVEKLLGAGPDAYVGLPITRSLSGAGGTPPPLLGHILAGNAAETGPPPFRLELSLRRRDGSPVETETVVTPLRPGETGARFLGVTRDVTERARAEREKEELEARLFQARKLESLGALAGGIAHDFNNLLSGVAGFLTLARMKVRRGEDPGPELERIGAASDRAADLVRQILAFSRKAPMELRVVEVGEVVQEALRLLRATLPGDVEVRQEILTDARVLADATRLHQVVINLCMNGARAMEPGGGVLTVRVEELPPGEGGSAGGGRLVRLTVADTGKGIPPELLDRIFDPFFTTRGDQGGTGLGLSVVHGIVASCRGTIRVESAPGKGARFEVLLPVTEGEAEGKAPPQDPAEPPLPGSGERILYAEDEPLQREYVEEALTRLGYRVETVPDGAEGLRRVREEPGRYDLLLSDLAMPNLRGNVLAEEARKAAPGLPVVLCTGYQDGFSEEDARRAGAGALLVKPVPLALLARTVRELLDGGRGAG